MTNHFALKFRKKYLHIKFASTDHLNIGIKLTTLSSLKKEVNKAIHYFIGLNFDSFKKVLLSFLSVQI